MVLVGNGLAHKLVTRLGTVFFSIRILTNPFKSSISYIILLLHTCPPATQTLCSRN